MRHDADLTLRGAPLLDGAPIECPRCTIGGQLTLDRRGPRETWPARLDCLTCGWGEDHGVITNGLITAALESSTGRHAVGDSDLFAAEWRGHTLEGERAPRLILADLTTAADALANEARKQGRTRWNDTKRQARKRVTSATRKVTNQVTDKVTSAGQDAARKVTSRVRVAVLGAAWQQQSQGATAPAPRRKRCRVKGCRAGYVTITTRLHSTTGKKQKRRIPCGVCHRAEA
jgi:hypothetical protein